MTHWKDYIYHPLHLDPVRLGFKFGQKYPPGFGRLTGQRHLGQDYLCKIGTPVYAIASGTTRTSNGTQSGLMITLTTNQGLSVRIMHLNKVVKGNGIVNRGDLIAYSGNTGVSTAPHSHIDIFDGIPTNIHQFSRFIDPLSLNYQINEEDMETKELRAIVEGIYWSFGMRQPDKQGVDFWLSEYKREAEKSKWLARILEGLRGEKIAQKPEALRYLDARENRWKTKSDVLASK